MTIMVHSEEDYNIAVKASSVLFGKATTDTLKELDEKTIMSIFDGVPTYRIDKNALVEGIKLTDLAVEKTEAFKSKGELRKLSNGGGISINKDKIKTDLTINRENLLNDNFLLIQQGKKNYKLIIAE